MTVTRQMSCDTLYCTGYWRMADNRKRSLVHYQRLVPRTMGMLAGRRLHLFCGDEEIAGQFAELAARYGVALTSEVIALGDLPTRDDLRPILDSCARLVAKGRGAAPVPVRREKATGHLWRDYQLSGPETFHDLLAVWTSKIPLLARLAAAQTDRAARLCWIDASVAKFNGRRTNWDFRAQRWPSGTLGHYGSPMRYRGAKLPLNASFLGAEAALWPQIDALFRAELRAHAGDGYPHDEETILSHVIAAAPGLFHRLGSPRRGIGGLPLRLAALGALPREAWHRQRVLAGLRQRRQA